MIFLGIVLYVIIGVVVGVGGYVFLNDWFDDECFGALAGTFWPLTLVLGLLICIIGALINVVFKVMYYLKTEGFHYHKEELQNCCGKCKYIEYTSTKGTNCRCLKSNKIRIAPLAVPCENFKQSKLWRFTIRMEE